MEQVTSGKEKVSSESIYSIEYKILPSKAGYIIESVVIGTSHADELSSESMTFCCVLHNFICEWVIGTCQKLTAESITGY